MKFNGTYQLLICAGQKEKCREEKHTNLLISSKEVDPDQGFSGFFSGIPVNEV
jgi:hypothetical protein